MKLCVVTSKECWREATGHWCAIGGFPAQMSAIASLFDSVRLVVVEALPQAGGNPLPPQAEMIPLRKPTGRDFTRKLSVAWALPYYARQLRWCISDADVVHIPLPGDVSFLGLVAALCSRKRILGRYCGSWTANGATTAMGRIVRRLMAWAAGGRNVMLATGEGSAPPAPHMHWLFASSYSAEDVARIQPDLRRGLSSPPRLVYVGRLSDEKGVDILVEALGALRRQGLSPLPRLLVAGGGPERSRLEAQVIGLACQDLVEFAGQLPTAELSRRLEACDLAVQPSRTEGYSKAWLEAMLHGLPVVASEVGAARAVIGGSYERGWLVPPGDPIALASVLQRVLDSDLDWFSLRQNCRLFAEQRTLDQWSHTIGTISAKQWGLHLRAGKLSPR